MPRFDLYQELANAIKKWLGTQKTDARVSFRLGYEMFAPAKTDLQREAGHFSIE